VSTYDIVGLSGTIIIGFSIPYCTISKNHVFMDFMINRLPPQVRKVMNTATRILAIALFAIISVNLFRIGTVFLREGEVSTNAHWPLFPFVFGLTACCIIECFALICETARIWGWNHE
jgi:TRAP-type C4-dicarboxylate transport system permease small subunit